MSGTGAIFLDRDGVLNDVVWRDGRPASPRTPDELVVAAGAGPALERLGAAGFRLFVVTNQPDVRRGLMTVEALDRIHARLLGSLVVDEIVACLHDDRDGCDCRKPRPGMLLDLARRWDVDLARSWMVGDQDRDTACGRSAGCRAVLLDRPYNSGADADAVVPDLQSAAAFILDSTRFRRTA